MNLALFLSLLIDEMTVDSLFPDALYRVSSNQKINIGAMAFTTT